MFARFLSMAMIVGAYVAGAAAEEPSTDSYQATMLPVSDAKADIAIMRRALETIHPGLYRYQSKAVIDKAFATLERASDAPIEVLALQREIALMLATIHCDHTKAEMPEAIDAFRTEHATHLPVRFELIEGRMIVTSNDGQPGAPAVGSELLTINGITVPKLLLSLSAAVAYDGDTDQAISKKLGDDSDLMGDDFNENYPLFYGFPETWSLVWKPIGAQQVQQSALKPISFKRWTALDARSGRYRDEFYKSITWRIAGKVARLKIDTFVNYRNPVQPTAFLAGFFREMKRSGTEHLILDLRNNGGGSENVSVALARYLFDQPFTWSKPVRYKAIRYGDLPQYIDSWGNRDELFAAPEAAFTRIGDQWYDRRPDPSADEDDDDNSTIEHRTAVEDNFSGKLTILSSGANASGATRTIAQMKERQGATIIGEDTAGSAEGPTAGQIFLLTLPNSGIKIRVPNAWNRTNIEKFEPRRGVAADRLVVPTLADFETGRDAALEVAQTMAPRPRNVAEILVKAFDGNWTGSLDYRDYGTEARVVLPTALKAEALNLSWTFDDGPGKNVRSVEAWTISPDGERLTIARGASRSEARIVAFDIDRKGGVTLVADGRAEENGRPAMSRLVVTRFDDRLRITEMTRRPGEPYLMRHRYELSPGKLRTAAAEPQFD